jgi:hypothetical protein
MGLKKLAAKVAEYNERLEHGKAYEIEPSHVERVLEKLHRKLADLEEELVNTKKADKKVRLTKKLNITREHIKRAEWLLQEIK